MLTNRFPFLSPDALRRDVTLPSNLVSLADDLQLIADGSAPTCGQIASAPVIDQWEVGMSVAGLRLFGRVGGHPHHGAFSGATVADQIRKPAARAKYEGDDLTALQLAVPLLVLCPCAEGYVSDSLIRAATHRIRLPQLDASTIGMVVKAVTGVGNSLAFPLSGEGLELKDLLLGIRFDRAPRTCFKQLVEQAESKRVSKGSRDLSLDDMHGVDGAVAWGRTLAADLAEFRLGKISWSAVDKGAVFVGPPGTGKTTVAKVIAEAANLNFIATSFAEWQSAGDGHLGHCLREIERVFAKARQRPTLLLIDELDSLPDRSRLGKDDQYFVSLVNCVIENCDGVRAGASEAPVVLVGACNDVSRCDPALLRSGRMNRVIRIGLPTPDDLVKMLRVRLGSDLVGEDLDRLGYLAAGCTGADVERIVKDARRTARLAGRTLTVSDLSAAIAGGTDRRTPAQMRRTALHEASHIVVDVVLNGPDGVHANITPLAGRGGMVNRTQLAGWEGTADDYRRHLQVLLAGRTGEAACLDEVSAGAGGVLGSDLHRAVTIAAAMAGSLGLAGAMPLLYLGHRDETEKLLRHSHVVAAVDHEMRKAEAACREIIEENLAVVKWTAQVLVERGYIDGLEVASAIQSLAPRKTAGSADLH